MAHHKISIHINLGGLIADLQRSVQRTINLVAFGLNTKQHITGDLWGLPDTRICITLDNNLRWDKDQAQREYAKWLLINGFRDAIESASVFLESVHQILSYWEIGMRQKGKGEVSGADWNEIVVKGRRSFHDLGFPKKLKHLSEGHILALDNTLTSQVLSINAARNCLVHRRGIVSEKDLKCGNGLKIKWMKIVLVLHDENGEKEVIPPFMAEKDSTVGMRNLEGTKVFPLGSQVEFTVQEFADICWSVFIFGNSLKKSVEDIGKDLGFLEREEKTVNI